MASHDYSTTPFEVLAGYEQRSLAHVAGAAALLSAFATYAAGFLVRPFGAIVFGRIGDLVGRKYTFLITILFMGGSTFLVGLLPTFQTIGWAAPIWRSWRRGTPRRIAAAASASGGG